MDAHHSAEENYVFGNCVRCHGLVRVPVTTRATTLVRCPRCQESFPLAEILDQEIPALEIVEERHASINVDTANPNEGRRPVERAAKTDDGRYVVPPQLAKAATSRRHRSSRTAKAVERESARAAGQTSGNRRERSRGRRKDKSFAKRRSERNTALDVVMVILGGCLSVPVAQLLIWWLIGADPLGLAPHTARFAPVLVPVALRDSEANEENEATETPGGVDESEADSRERRKGSDAGAGADANPVEDARSTDDVSASGNLRSAVCGLRSSIARAICHEPFLSGLSFSGPDPGWARVTCAMRINGWKTTALNVNDQRDG